MRKVSKMNQNPLQQLMMTKEDNGQYINTIERVSHHHSVFLDDDIQEPSAYRELISILFNAGEEDTIDFFINSNGGHLDTAIAVVEGLKNTQAQTNAVLIGACHSAASIITLYTDNIVVLDSAYMMVHGASFGSSGTTSNVKSHAIFTSKMVEKLLDETYESFLTKEELVKVKSGAEIWLDAVEIRERAVSRNKMLEKRYKAQAKQQKKGECDGCQSN